MISSTNIEAYTNHPSSLLGLSSTTKLLSSPACSCFNPSSSITQWTPLILIANQDQSGVGSVNLQIKYLLRLLTKNGSPSLNSKYKIKIRTLLSFLLLIILIQKAIKIKHNIFLKEFKIKIKIILRAFKINRKIFLKAFKINNKIVLKEWKIKHKLFSKAFKIKLIMLLKVFKIKLKMLHKLFKINRKIILKLYKINYKIIN